MRTEDDAVTHLTTERLATIIIEELDRDDWGDVDTEWIRMVAYGDYTEDDDHHDDAEALGKVLDRGRTAQVRGPAGGDASEAIAMKCGELISSDRVLSTNPRPPRSRRCPQPARWMTEGGEALCSQHAASFARFDMASVEDGTMSRLAD